MNRFNLLMGLERDIRREFPELYEPYFDPIVKHIGMQALCSYYRESRNKNYKSWYYSLGQLNSYALNIIVLRANVALSNNQLYRFWVIP